tara:strand:- start:8468 stop:8665 length:198 start_codon:yes stop_codon:yes gene_type:complete
MIATACLALGLVLIVEGLAYALAPLLVERLLETLRLMAEDQRRMLGLIAMTAGFALVWAAKGMGA